MTKNRDWIISLISIIIIFGVGFGAGAILMANDIEKDCFYKGQVSFGEDRVFSCDYMKGVSEK